MTIFSKIVLPLFLLLFGASIHGQELNPPRIIPPPIQMNQDSLPHIRLKEIPVYPPYPFKNKRQRRIYSRLVRDVKKAYPYSMMAKETLSEIGDSLNQIKNKKERRKYIRKTEDVLFEKFEKPLRRLTIRQGRILIKLIYRETGSTTYEIIKEYKGGVNAFFWQTLARLFGSNLKNKYDPSEEDRMIEHIITLIEAEVI